jgi:hypothetical protein
MRRLAAIMAADVFGYSRLMDRDKSGTLSVLKAVRHETSHCRSHGCLDEQAGQAPSR